MTHELVDICFNFTHSAFRKDEQAVLSRAVEAGVSTMIITGSSEPDSRLAMELAHRHPTVLFATAGVHPHLSREWTPDSPTRLRGLAADPKVVAIGEAGLDYNRDYSPRPDQRRAFAGQMELAVDLGLPLFLHERDAYGDFLAMLRDYREALGKVVVHCFTGTGEQLETYLELDLYIGLTGWICDERRGTHLHPLISRIPLERLMIETDAPYLLPRDLPQPPRDRRNEPAYLPHILHTLARLLRRDPAEVATVTTATARGFYRLPDQEGS